MIFDPLLNAVYNILRPINKPTLDKQWTIEKYYANCAQLFLFL
jgi:hypothetical protein